MKSVSLILALGVTLAACSPLDVDARASVDTTTCTLPCASNAVCITTPKKRCVVPHGTCGGFAGFQCANPSDICVDDPRDSCDPKNGGADCIGLCVSSGVVSCGGAKES